MSEFCSVATRQAGQSIVGTAAGETSAWLLIEHRAPWEAKAVEQADFGPDLRPRLVRCAQEIAGFRIQLIRHPGVRSGPLAVYFGVSTPGRSMLVAMDVDEYRDLASTDLVGTFRKMQAGERPGLGAEVERPVVLVCTHGKRDPCCAKWGLPLYQSLQARDDIDLWQTSHLGGHRFAPTLLTFPDGLCYGWLDPDEAGALVDATLRGEVYRLDRFRGRTAWSGAGQAAEHFAREATGELRIDGVQVIEVQGSGPEHFVANVIAAGKPYRLELARVQLGQSAPPSCSKAPEVVSRYSLESLVAL